jgi:DNA transformation protein
MKLRDLKGLGPKSEKQLNEIGISSKDDLEQIGVINAFIKSGIHSSIKSSLNFLYAMVGALENKHWQEIAKNNKHRLLMELEDIKELNK